MIVTAASSAESSRFVDQLVENEGLFPSRYLLRKLSSLRYPGGEGGGCDGILFRGRGDDFENILKNTGCANDPEPVDDDWDVLNPQSPTDLLASHPVSPSSPPQAPPASPRSKKSSVGKAWSKSRKLFMKFGRRQALPKLSDKLVPEHGEVRWYESLFSKPQKPTAARKYPYLTVDT